MDHAAGFLRRNCAILAGRRLTLATGLLLGLLVGGTAGPAAPRGSIATAEAASGQVHLRIQGHIVALSPGQIQVRDRRNVVHVILLAGTTTYWYKLEPKTFHNLTMGMRVYVLGLPGKNGTVTALKIHLYYPRAHKAKGATG